MCGFSKVCARTTTLAEFDFPTSNNELDRNMLLRMSARAVMRPPLSLHEAARRGTPADVQRFMGANLNAVDGTGMTPLAWAIVRNNSSAIMTLFDAGANPWIGSETQTSAVYFPYTSSCQSQKHSPSLAQ
jgi:hypothetical protein